MSKNIVLFSPSRDEWKSFLSSMTMAHLARSSIRRRYDSYTEWTTIGMAYSTRMVQRNENYVFEFVDVWEDTWESVFYRFKNKKDVPWNPSIIS